MKLPARPASWATWFQKKRFYIPEEDRWVTLRVSAAGLRTINKLGIQAVAQELGI